MKRRISHIFGEMVKDEVRALAKKFELPVAQSKESFDICFIPGDNYRDFLMRHMPEWCVPGEVVDTEGNSVGEHTGLPFYSIGQRRGFTSNKPIPYYVVGFNKEKNQLVVGNGEDCNRKRFSLHSETFASDRVDFPLKCSVRLRHMGSMNNAILEKKDDAVYVTLDQAQRSISPGQSAVFYDGNTLLGGGVIDNVVV
jgi:tRNA-uridine 2-sulfurtransferase